MNSFVEFLEDTKRLSFLAKRLKNASTVEEKSQILLQDTYVQHALESNVSLSHILKECSSQESYALLALAAIGQVDAIFSASCACFLNMQAILSQIVAIDHFYESIGGIVGYQEKVVHLLSSTKALVELDCLQIEKIPLQAHSKETLEGIFSLEKLAEIYPIGGLGSRLNLESDSKEPLPVACLPFCGRTLLEGMIRDVQAREFLYTRLFGKTVTVPIAIMTSHEKKNTTRIEEMCVRARWFGRHKESFFLFAQLSVPVVSETGHWSFRASGHLHVEPGGHGALWRTAEEDGVFSWLQDLKKEHLLIRQINNPLAGVDSNLLTFVGMGIQNEKVFGVIGCDRCPKAAEGVWALVEKNEERYLSNIEYTDFAHLNVSHLEQYPANTNILYAHLPKLLPALKKNPLPGLIFNKKTKIDDHSLGGRLESMMQNISESLVAKKDEPLETFLAYANRKKVISVTKREYQPGGSLLETPEGAFYDLLHTHYVLLKEECGMQVPAFCTEEEYVNQGPSLLFLYHPALGPLYSLIKQKILGGKMEVFSELQLEIADVCLENLYINGSLLIETDQVLGHRDDSGRVCYSSYTGKCILKNVSVLNRGIDRQESVQYWKNVLIRHEKLSIYLEGCAEFYAEDCVFEGAMEFVVPDGERWVVSSKNSEISIKKEPVGWRFNYTFDPHTSNILLNLSVRSLA